MPDYFKKVLTDGSQWDSNQHRARLLCVLSGFIDSFLDVLEPYLPEFLHYNGAEISVKEFVRCLKQVYLDLQNFLFVPIHEIDGPQWS